MQGILDQGFWSKNRFCGRLVNLLGCSQPPSHPFATGTWSVLFQYSTNRQITYPVLSMLGPPFRNRRLIFWGESYVQEVYEGKLVQCITTDTSRYLKVHGASTI